MSNELIGGTYIKRKADQYMAAKAKLAGLILKREALIEELVALGSVKIEMLNYTARDDHNRGAIPDQELVIMELATEWATLPALRDSQIRELAGGEEEDGS